MQFYESLQNHYIFFGAWVFVFGACIGSFLNVVIWRLPREESIVHVPSHCPKCNKDIRWFENIPILSWLALRGRCSKCRAPISPRYIFVEALTGFLFIAVWFRAWQIWRVAPHRAWPPSMIFAYLFLVAALMAISFIDIDHRIVPNEITYFGVAVGLVTAVIWPGTHELIEAPGRLDYMNHKLALKAFVSVISRVFPAVLNSARILALIDAVLGVLIGGGVLWLLSELGKLLRGKTTITSDEPVVLTLKRKGFDDPEEGFQDWEDNFIRARDQLVIKGQIESINLRRKAKSEAPPDFDQIKEIVVTEDGVQIGETTLPLDDIKSIPITTREWTIPLEPMGLGDATLMAMVGAFLGPGGVIFVLTIGSLIGAALGIMKMVVDRAKLHSALPFGPSLAVGAACYMLLFYELVRVWFWLMKLAGVAPGTS